jgi:pimeloyl-ACP methyl ester carboxylesterase
MIGRIVERISDGAVVELNTQLHSPSGENIGSVIMLHGLLLGSIATWYFGAARELNRHQVILYDLRGHGNSSISARGYDIDSMVDDLLAIINSYELQRVSLVGHSYGAVIAAHFALRYPEKIDGLFLVDMPCDVQKLVVEPLVNVTNRESLIAALPGDLSEKFQQGKRGAKKLVEKLEHLLFDTSLVSDLKKSALFTVRDWAQLPTNSAALYGDKSDCLADAQLSNGGHINLQIITGGHFLPLEAGQEVAKRIKEYFYG